MAKVVVENVYKSYSRREGEENFTPVATESLVASSSQLSSTQTKSSSKSSPQVNVLRNINFTVDDGEFMVLVGPSGCGKSTLLRIIAGLEELTAGNIWIGKSLVNDLPPKARDIAMVFQNYALYPHLKVYDNIAFGLRRTSSQKGRTGEGGQKNNSKMISKWLEKLLVSATRSLPRNFRYLSATEKEIDRQIKSVASLLQIETLLHRLPKELSGGQKQRVALGRAIARNPQVFLMDEPLSNLDAKLRADTRAQIVKLQRQLGTTTIYVTHDQTEAMTMGDRIAVMNQGKIQQIAPPLEIYHQPANRFVAEFIGSPPMNFLPVEWVAPLTLKHPQFSLTLPPHWSQPLQAYQGRSLLLGVRPQHFYLSDASQENFRAIIDLVEALGNETYISVHLAEDINCNLQIRIPTEQFVCTGKSINVSIDVNKIHLFVGDSGESILLNS
ncbi:carbohydrate ABC transporter ATP-binding protein, CUT1 family [Stanieria cyanosphaera PCC 7437]|uniref:Carbohydrate ABC transporter ATP-binding protein, CUT1 family n=1 Tax=Stanieria cyanosphaera (strain ATCC 29371 / PCC 7437) TaxID=111780 RepID=K9XUD6_STAC7|nr:ABC transporter ATP-binding protein [Stanieria cyanosphaera]AFZ35287.1 carbohydrate ABC transporter ATP-binding protein, CUT1 family [Stanieria cyanosphaera PCC 7437]